MPLRATPHGGFVFRQPHTGRALAVFVAARAFYNDRRTRIAAAKAITAWTDFASNVGNSRRISSTVAPSASEPNSVRIVTRVPRTTGSPPHTVGSRTMYRWKSMTSASMVMLDQASKVKPAFFTLRGVKYPLPRLGRESSRARLRRGKGEKRKDISASCYSWSRINRVVRHGAAEVALRMRRQAST
jgi:hypothetical protein